MKQVGQLAMCRDARALRGRDRGHGAGRRAARVAEDGCELVEVDYEPLPVVADMVAAAEPGAPVLHPEWGDNVAVSFKTGFGDVGGRAAPGRRHGCGSASTSSATSACRSRRAAWSPSGTRATARSPRGTATQVVHFVQQGLVAALGLPPHKIRVIAPDVGGGFGTKANGYPEDLLIPAAAIASRRPVKWTEDRREHMMALGPRARTRCTTSRSRRGATGPCSAVRDRIWLDLGAYNSWGIVLPYNTVAHLLGPAPRAEPRRRVPRRRHQQDAERALPRRRPPRDRLRHGPHRGLPRPRARAWTRPSCAGATT